MGDTKLIQEPTGPDEMPLEDEQLGPAAEPVNDVPLSETPEMQVTPDDTSPNQSDVSGGLDVSGDLDTARQAAADSPDGSSEEVHVSASEGVAPGGADGPPESQSLSVPDEQIDSAPGGAGEVNPAGQETDGLDDGEADDDEEAYEDVEPIEEISAAPEEELKRDWYILKVQSNREQSICDGLRRRVAVEGLDEFFGDVLVPTEDVAEFKNGKRRVVKRKLYPGYIVVNMVINDETRFLVRETPGIGDFTGSAGKPTPMLPHEVERIVRKSRPDEEGEQPIKTAIPFKQGDRVRIKEGTFENFEGDVDGIDEANGRVTVMINIFGRSTPVELEHWQIDAV